MASEAFVVVVGSLSYDATAEDVKAFFAGCGEVNSVSIPTFEDSGKSRGKAFVEFATEAAATAAVSKDGSEMMGRRLRVNLKKSAAAYQANGGGRGRGGGGAQQVADAGTAVFVGNLSYGATVDDVKGFFAGCGEVKGVRIPASEASGKSRGKAFVEFATDAACGAAVGLDGTEMMGRQLRISRLSSKPGDRNGGGRGAGRGGGRGGGARAERPAAAAAATESNPNTVFVGNLPFSAAEADVRAVFQDCGEIANVRVAWDRQRDRSKGFAYVEFVNVQSVRAAIAKAGADIGGRQIRVDMAIRN